MKIQSYKLLISTMLLIVAFMSNANDNSDGMSLNGIAEYTKLNRSYYIGALYSTWPNVSPELLLDLTGRKRMFLKLTGDWSPRSFSNSWAQAITLNGNSKDLTRLQDDIVIFSNIAKKSFQAADEIVIDSYGDGKTETRVNGTLVHITNDPAFFKLLLGVWVGSKPPSREFKLAMLSLTTPSDHINRFTRLKADTARRIAVAKWYR